MRSDAAKWQERLTRFDRAAQLPLQHTDVLNSDVILAVGDPHNWPLVMRGSLVRLTRVDVLAPLARIMIAHHLVYTVAPNPRLSTSHVRSDLATVVPLFVPPPNLLHENAQWALRLLDATEGMGAPTMRGIWTTLVEPSIAEPLPVDLRLLYTRRFNQLLEKVFSYPLDPVESTPRAEIEFLIRHIVNTADDAYHVQVDPHWRSLRLRRLEAHLTKRVEQWHHQLDEETEALLRTGFHRGPDWRWVPLEPREFFIRPVAPRTLRRRAFDRACAGAVDTSPATFDDFRVRVSGLSPHPAYRPA